MQPTEPSQNKRKRWSTSTLGYVLMGLGVVGLGLGVSPLGNPPQCGDPGAGSNCVIGANIGGGLIVLLGLTFLVGGLLTIVGGWIWEFFANRNKSGRS